MDVVIPALALLGIVLLLRFVGCDFEHGMLSETGWDYRGTIMNTAGLVSSWRLGELTGPTANDETAAHPGSYQTVTLAATPTSPATASPPVLSFGVTPSLIESDAVRTSIRVDGGYVNVPFSPAVNPSAFTIEAWVVPEWDPAETGLFRSVISSREEEAGGILKGHMLMTGPDPNTLGDTTTRWLAAVGNGGTAWQWLAGPAVDFTAKSHLAVTYDGATLKLYVNGSDDTEGTPDARMATGYSPNPGAPLYIGMGAPERDPPNTPLFPFKGRIQGPDWQPRDRGHHDRTLIHPTRG